MAKKKQNYKLVYVFPNGEKYDVIGENGKYYLCEGTQFRKSAERGILVKEEIGAEEEPQPETEE